MENNTIKFYDVDYRIDHEAKTAMAPWIVKLAEDAYAGLERRGKLVELVATQPNIPWMKESIGRLFTEKQSLWDRILNWILFR